MTAMDEELEGLSEAMARKVRFVAEYMAMMDVNAGIGQFSSMPESVQRDYLHDARNAVNGCIEWEKQNPIIRHTTRKPFVFDENG